jgi:hypothetical protein
MASAKEPTSYLKVSLAEAARVKQPLTRGDLNVLIENAVGILRGMDLHKVAKNPPELTSISVAYLWARCIPIVMTERSRSAGYSIAQEQEDDVIWSLRSRAEDYLTQTVPTSVTEAVLMIDLYTSEDFPCDCLYPVCKRLEHWLFDQAGQPDRPQP